MDIDMDMEVFISEVFEELGIMSESNRDKIEMICSLQEQIAGARNKQLEILEGVFLSGQKKFTKDPEKRQRLLLGFSQLMERFPKIKTTIEV